jgi:hypothetical protein
MGATTMQTDGVQPEIQEHRFSTEGILICCFSVFCALILIGRALKQTASGFEYLLGFAIPFGAVCPAVGWWQTNRLLHTLQLSGDLSQESFKLIKTKLSGIVYITYLLIFLLVTSQSHP